MNRLSSLLALGAIVVAGAFAGAAAQASATPSIAFNVNNADSSTSMIRTSASGNISGLITPPAAILAGSDDPATGAALFTGAALLRNGDHTEASVHYANAGNTSANVCSFNMQITRITASSYKAHFWISEGVTNCTVPADVTNSNGDFTGTTYTLVWKT
ncbi:MAG: hypothetical protein M3N49_07385 [Candidatus Eremiobacteraeota bacterium]|nr:hypothetical protein [Candidatus Eremiobacteraeota bacterium]